MMRPLLISSLLELAMLIAPSFAYGDQAISSPRIENFHLQDCLKGVCFSAKGQTAFVALGRPALSAVGVTIKIESAHMKTKSFSCDSFRYDVTTRLAVCDNRDVHLASVTIDENLLVTKFL